MSEANVSINYSGRRYGSTVVARGNLVIEVEDNPDYLTVATTANRNGRRSSAIALSYAGANSSGGTISIQQTGLISAEVSGLAAGSASWVRCSATGTIERCTPATGDDLVGYADADGRVHLMFGMLTPSITNGNALNGTEIETTDTPSTGEVWLKNGTKFRAKKPVPPGFFDVTNDYGSGGAVGDGSHDDTAAINAAIAAANAAAPAVVFFPPGTYKVTSQLTTPAAHVCLRGATHRNCATIQSYVTDTLIYLSEEDSSQVAKYISVENFVFECHVDQSGDAQWLADSGTITCDVNAIAGTFTRSSGSFVSDGFVVGQRIKPAGFSNAANNYGRVIQTVTPTVITVTSTTGLVNESGTGDESISSPFEVAAGAAIEVRGGGKIQIRNCAIRNFPIGICLDGALETHIEHCEIFSIVGLGYGYTDAATNGKGVWLVDGSTRGRGFTTGGAVNVNQINHCWMGGYKRDVDINGGLSNQIHDVVFASTGAAGLSAICLANTQAVDISACESEGYGGSGSSSVLIADAVYGATIRNNFFSAEVPIRTTSPGQLYNSAVIYNTLNPVGSNNAIYKWNASCIPYLVCLGNKSSGAGDFTNNDGGNAAFGFNAGPTNPKGISVNKISPAQAVIDAYLADATSWLRFSAYGDVVRYDHSSSSAQKQNVEHFFPSLSTSNLAEDGKFIQSGQTADGAGATSVCLSTAIPANAVVTARWTVLQQKDGVLTTYGSWIYEQDVYRDGSGSLTLVGSPSDVKGGGAVNTGATFTAPTLVDAGSNQLAVSLSGISGAATIYFAKLEIFACVR